MKKIQQKSVIRRAIGHFVTITRHRHKVIAHCSKAGILWQGLWHDLSKYSPTEFVPGVRYYTGARSPNEGERHDIGYSLAWLHHKGRNRHHFEYWVDYNIETHKNEPIEMPYRFVAEMFCDRVAASKIYNKKDYKQTDPFKYFENKRQSRDINQVTSKQLEELLKMLADEGEEKTFKYLRKRLKEKRVGKRKTQ